MKHEILWLKRSRAYVLVNDVWYDAHAELNPQVGQNYLNGQIQRVLSFEEYKKEFPESKNEMYDYVSDKTISGGFIRRVVEGVVKYGVDPTTSRMNLPQEDFVID